MKWNKLKSLVLMAVLGSMTVISQAAALTDVDIPSDSNWYVHVNLELIRTSGVGRQFMMETFNEAMDDIEEELGIDVREKIEGVTVFGGQLPGSGDTIKDGAVVLHGVIDDPTRQGLLDKLEAEGAVINEFTESGQDYYTIQKDGALLDGETSGVELEGDLEELLFSFGPTQLLVTKSHALMQGFLSAGGYLNGTDQVRSDALLILQADRALLQGGANTSAEIGEDWDSSVLKNVDSVALLVAEEQGGLLINAHLLATSAEVALSVRNIVEGMVALKALSDTETVVGDVLRNVRFENDGAILKMSVVVAADQIEALKEL